MTADRMPDGIIYKSTGHQLMGHPELRGKDSPIYAYTSQMLSFLGFSQLKFHMHFSSTLCITHALLITFIFISTPQYWVTATNYESGRKMKQPYHALKVDNISNTSIQNHTQSKTVVVLSKDELPP